MLRIDGSLAVAACAAMIWFSSGVPPAAAQARPIPLDTLRVAATSLAAAEIATGTRAVTVITAEEIRRSPAATVGELLGWELGVDVMPRSPALVDVAIRGSSFEQILVMVDGVRVSDAQTGHFDLDLAVPLDQIARIEVLRGPASTLHGADALGGVVNIVTRRGGASTARAQGGSFGTARLAGAHTAAVGSIRTDLGVDLLRSDGHRTGTDYRMGLGRVGITAPLAGRTLSVDAGYAARDFGADGFYGPYPSWEETRTATLALALRPADSERFSLEPTVNLRRHDDLFVLRRADPGFYRNEHSTLEAGAELVARGAVAPGVRGAAGVEAYTDRLESERLGDREQSRTAALLEVAAGEVGALSGTAGIRVDRHEAFGTFWSPSAAVAWWPTMGLRLRSSVGRAFRAPTWTERFYSDPANIGDPDLATERSWSGDVGVDAYPVAGLRVGIGAFYRRAENLVDWARPNDQPEAPWRTRNVETAEIRGLELELGAADVLGIRWVGTGTWLSMQTNEEPGFTSKYALRPMAEVVTLSAAREAVEGFEVTVRGRRARRLGEEGYYRLDARAAYEIPPGRLYLDLQNASDEAFADITGLPAPGRSFQIGLELRHGR